jgi:hyperosmotically inducible protein
MKLRSARLAAVAVIGLFTGAGSAGSVFAADISIDPQVKFRRLDTNHDGFLARSELRRYPVYLKVLEEADLDADGKLSRDEFANAEVVYQRLQAAASIDDSLLSERVRAALGRDLRAADVSVDTFRGHVLLSGFVTSSVARSKALRAASSVQGVVAVKDGLVVR